MSDLTDAPSVAIVGRPNVGKSALFNRLVGRKVAIVHDQPGITRDRIIGVCSRGRRSFSVWDTGGIFGAGESQLTRDVRRVVEAAVKDSDVLLFVVDGRHGLSPIDEEIARMLRKTGKPMVLAVNKVDTDKHEDYAVDFDSLGFGSGIAISAAHGRGIGELVAGIGQLFPQTRASITGQSSVAALPVRIAIVGRPNVGKSSLINAIVRTDRAIVSEHAGTTRDAVDISYTHGDQRFVFIDTAGIRRRGAHSSSVEVFSVMRAERTIKRADLCVLIVDLTAGVTAQDKRIAGLIQKAHRPCILVLNKWDLIKPRRDTSRTIKRHMEETRADVFFLDYAPVLVASAKTRENVERLFRLIDQVRGAARKRIGTGVLNRLLRAAFAANPPPMVSGKRLKLFYATQAGGVDRQGPAKAGDAKNSEHQIHRENGSPIQPPEFVLFVNEPRLLGDTYHRYLEARIRTAEPYPGLPILLTMRPRATSLQVGPGSRRDRQNRG
jgi:GTP-binding protein